MDKRKYFKESLEKGEEFEVACKPYLQNLANESSYHLLHAKQILPVEEYRLGNLRFPDYIMIDMNGGLDRYFIEMKRKSGWIEHGQIYVTVEKKYIDDYLEISRKYDAPIIIIIYCEITNKAYQISDFNMLKEKHFNNKYGNNTTYQFFVNDLKEIQELENIL